MLRRGGVHAWPVFREKMAGENLQQGSVEVASEQWDERSGWQAFSSAQRKFPTLYGKWYRKNLIFSVSAECRKKFLKLGGNTDCLFALSQRWFRAFFYCIPFKTIPCICLCGWFSARCTRISSTYAPRTPQKFVHTWQRIISQIQIQSCF